MGGQQFAVSGLSWFDHEWATNQLAANQVGWDWFGLQLDDGSDLMLIHFRTKDGDRDPNSAGTFVDPNGVATPLSRRSLRSIGSIRGQARKRAASIRWHGGSPSPVCTFVSIFAPRSGIKNFASNPSRTGRDRFALRARLAKGTLKVPAILK